MKTIQLPEELMIETTGHSSKGNQPKWLFRNKYYKADHMGYEGLSEVLISSLLEKTNIDNFVRYEPVVIEWDKYRRNGCYSKSFLGPKEELIPLEKLYRNYHGVGLAKTLREITDVKERIQTTVSFVEKVTGLKGFGPYLGAMIEIDAFFLNEDRHTNNIAVIHNDETGVFRFCPYFDHGLSLLSDLQGFWMDGDTGKHMLRVSAKPFGTFQQQRDAVIELYGPQFKISFDMSDVDHALEELGEFYRPEYLKRVRYVIQKQLEKYP